MKGLNPSKTASIDNLSGKFLEDGADILARRISQRCNLSIKLILSKVIERIIHDQAQEFLSKNKILYRFQSGFRKNYSTNTCLGHLTDKINTGFEKGLFTGMILIDLQKAFDTIDHQILTKKT